MKKLLFKIIALCLVVCSTVALFTACGSPAVEDKREKIELGLYPQTEVLDTEEINEKTYKLDDNGEKIPDGNGGYVMVNKKLVDKLLELAGDPNVDKYSWTSYKYYSKGSQSNCMRYADVEYDGKQYRGVYIDFYRNYYWDEMAQNDKQTWQDNNGYKKKVLDDVGEVIDSGVYWFKYEPIVWTVVKEEAGFKTLVSNVILDSQPFQNTYGGNPEKNECFNNTNGASDKNVKANNYEKSTIRTWLNETFFNLAFSANDIAKIQTVEVDNSAVTTGYADNAYACSNTSDKVFLLSYKEVTEYFNSNALRCKKTTDYAKANGAYTFKLDLPTDGNGNWWLRSADSKISFQARAVDTNGVAVDTSAIKPTEKDYLPYAPYLNVAFSQYGVVPAIKIAVQ